MNIIEIFLQTVWGTLIVLGWVKVILILVLISILSRIQSVLGLVAALLFIAYLAHWI